MLLIYTNIINLYQHFKFWFFFLACGLIVVIIPIVTYIISPNAKSIEKVSSYECGFEPFDDSRGTFDIHFFIIAVLFLIFDLEIAFIFPWAKFLFFLGPFSFWVMILFLGILTIGFIYEWKRGALDWVTKIPNSLRKEGIKQKSCTTEKRSSPYDWTYCGPTPQATADNKWESLKKYNLTNSSSPKYCSIQTQNTTFFRQNYLILIYIKNYLNFFFLSLVHYTSVINSQLYYIGLTYYKSTPLKTKTKTKRVYFTKKCKRQPKKLDQNLNYILKKNYLKKVTKYLYLNYTFFFQTQKYYCWPICTQKYKLRKTHLFFDIKNTSSKFEKKIQSLLNDRILNIKLLNYILQFFKVSINLSVKNIKSYLKNTARRLNKKLFNQSFFYKKFLFFKDMLYIINICTYCQTPQFLAEHLVTCLCTTRKQWSVINVATFVLKKMLKIRVNIRGLKLAISGRLQGRTRKKTFIKLFGTLPCQTVSLEIKRGFSANYNVFGMFGVRIWMYPL